MSLEEFKKEFYESRLDEWKNKYLKFKELLHLIKLIRNDIKSHGGEINNDDIDIKLSTISENSNDKLDRRSSNLDVLNDTKGIFDKDAKIFNSPIMYEIDKAYTEINSLQFEDDIKIFLYFLQIEVHNVYVFYLSIEKEIYTRTNSYLYERINISGVNNEDQISNQLKELIEIAYLTYSFYLYIDLNIEAVKYILEYFDKNFIKINNGISIKKLFFNKNILNKESDLKYILGFKIINECSVLLENYCYETKNNYPKNKNILEQCKELQDVLSYIIEKDTNRVDDNLFEVYQRDNKQNNILKKKENLELNIQNSFLLEDSENELLEEESEYDRQIKIQITNSNIINLIFIYIHIFFYSFFGIIPYIVLFLFCIEKGENNDEELEKIKYYEISFALSSTHLGSLLSKYIISKLERYKLPFIFFGICFSVSFGLTLMSFILLDDFEFDYSFVDKYLLFFIFSIISRFIYGLSGGRVISRKYINLFLPESKIRFYSILYMILVNFGYIFGVIFLYILIYIKVEFYIFIIKIDRISLPFFIGFFFSLIYIILIIIFFTEPNEEGKMLSNKISINGQELKINSINGNNEELKIINKEDNKSSIILDNNNNKINIQKKTKEDIHLKKISTLISGQNLIYLDEDDFEEEEDYLSINAKSDGGLLKKQKKIKELKTVRSSKKKLKKIKKLNNINQTGSLLNCISTSGENESYMKRQPSIASIKMEEKILTAEEIKGLNSIEKAIISINTGSNFNDTNLFPKELDRIKDNQSKNNNNAFFRTILVFIFLLNISNMLNEFILLLIQINYNVFDNDIDKDIKKSLYSIFIILLISFIFSFFFTKTFKKRINRKYLVILNIFLIIINSLIIFFLVTTTELRKTLCLIGVLLIYITNCLIIGLTSLFSEKIVPPFVKFFCFNVKYLISYISTIGKLLGGISFSVMMYFIERKYEKIKYLTIFAIIYDCLSFFCLVILFINYNSLKMKALSKLKTFQL